MLVKLNAWRDGLAPGDVVDLPEQDAATLIHHGAAQLHDDIDAALDAAEADAFPDTSAAEPDSAQASAATARARAARKAPGGDGAPADSAA
jgi:hypothetical protein